MQLLKLPKPAITTSQQIKVVLSKLSLLLVMCQNNLISVSKTGKLCVINSKCWGGGEDFLHTCVPTPVQDIQLEELR